MQSTFNFRTSLFLSISSVIITVACQKRDFGDAQTNDLVGSNSSAIYDWQQNCDFSIDWQLKEDFEKLNPPYSIDCFTRRDRRTNEEGSQFLVIHWTQTTYGQGLSTPPIVQMQVKLGERVADAEAMSKNKDYLADPKKYGYSAHHVLLAASEGAWKPVAVVNGDKKSVSLCRGEDYQKTFFYSDRFKGRTIDPSITFKLQPCDLPKIDPKSGAPVQVIQFKSSQDSIQK